MSKLILIITSFILSLFSLTSHPTPSSPAITPVVLGARTKTSDCIAQGPLPDSACTPGDIFPNVTVAQICTSGYSSSVRNVSSSTKNHVYSEYNILTHSPGQYEVDHLISLELGGSNSISNLWPEPADPRPGYHEKDRVENYLHDQVCSGKMDLNTAQHLIATDWLSVFNTLPGNYK